MAFRLYGRTTRVGCSSSPRERYWCILYLVYSLYRMWWLYPVSSLYDNHSQYYHYSSDIACYRHNLSNMLSKQFVIFMVLLSQTSFGNIFCKLSYSNYDRWRGKTEVIVIAKISYLYDGYIAMHGTLAHFAPPVPTVATTCPVLLWGWS